MIGALRELLFLALAAALSWWLFLSGPVETADPEPEPPDRRVLPVTVLPEVVPPAPEPQPEPEPELASAQEAPAEPLSTPAAAESAPPPPQEVPPAEPEPAAASEAERLADEAAAAPAPDGGAPEAEAEADVAALEDGTPEGTDDGARDAPEDPWSGGRAPAELAHDPELTAAAHAELSGEVRRGFDTVLLAAPEEQLEIARAFDEELVLVPRRALDPEGSPYYYRVDPHGAGDVERVAAKPPLELRRYRDLFDYEYARLPEPLRGLRRSVLARSEVYVFAALIPLSEWAVVVGRRREALATAGLEPDDVRRFDLRYVRLADGRFDLRVESIVLADGRRLTLSGRLDTGKDLR